MFEVSVHSDVSLRSCRSAWACVKYLRMGKADRCSEMVGVGVDWSVSSRTNRRRDWAGEQRTRDRLRYGVGDDGGRCVRNP